MPELPEVETIRRSLHDLIADTIREVALSAVAPIRHTTAAQLHHALVGAQVEDIARRGKFLLFRLVEGPTLILHLGMSGRLRRATTASPHTHMVLQFAHAGALHYIDARRFGMISLASAAQRSPCLDHLGPEFDDPELTSPIWIARCRRHPKLSLKAALLHQGLVAGLGNIYVCEVLYAAGISPLRTIGATTDAALARILVAMRTVLTRAIAQGGTSLRDYEDSWGRKGGMRAHLQVYGRKRQSTLDGRGHVVRVVQQGRSTWYAPEVQK